MDRQKLDALLADMRSYVRGSCPPDAMRRYADRIEAACAPGEPPVEGAIPLDVQLWLRPVTDAEYASCPGSDVEPYWVTVWPDGGMVEGDWLDARELTARGWPVPEPPQPARQFERGDIVVFNGIAGNAEVVHIEGDQAWVRWIAPGVSDVVKLCDLRLVDTESTR